MLARKFFLGGTSVGVLLGFGVGIGVGTAAGIVTALIAVPAGVALDFWIFKKSGELGDKARNAVMNKFAGDSGNSPKTGTFQNVNTKNVRPLSQKQTAVASDEWKCACGKINKNYTGTCSCGIKKSDAEKEIKRKKELDRQARERRLRGEPEPETEKPVVSETVQPVAQLPQKEYEAPSIFSNVNTRNVKPLSASAKSEPLGKDQWRCVCGRANPNYTGTCACGVKKSDISRLMREKQEADKKAREQRIAERRNIQE